MSVQGEIRSGTGLMVAEPPMSPNSSKAGQVKQKENHPVKSVGLDLQCVSLFSCLSGGWKKCLPNKE